LYEFAGEADIVITCMALTNETVSTSHWHFFINLLDFYFTFITKWSNLQTGIVDNKFLAAMKKVSAFIDLIFPFMLSDDSNFA
jgi:hypothetical protein